MTQALQARTPETVMRKYMGILNVIEQLGPLGFADVLDTASPAELAELDGAADSVQRQIDRTKRAPR